MSKQYETVFILTPVLSETQVRDAVDKFRAILSANGGEILHEEDWGLRKLAYPIQKKNSGFYSLIEYTAPGTAIDVLETEFRRDERVIRFLTVALDKHAVAYNEKRRKGEVGKKKAEKEAATNESEA